MDRRGIRGVVPEDVGGEGVGRKDISCSRWPPSTYTYTHRHVGIIYFIMENPIWSQAKCPSRITRPEQRISLYLYYIYICSVRTAYIRHARYKWTYHQRHPRFRWKFGHLCTSSVHPAFDNISIYIYIRVTTPRDYFVTLTLDIKYIYIYRRALIYSDVATVIANLPIVFHPSSSRPLSYHYYYLVRARV